MTAAAPELRVTLDRAAELTGLSVETFRTWIRAKQLTVRYPTSKPMILMSEVHALMEGAPASRGRER